MKVKQTRLRGYVVVISIIGGLSFAGVALAHFPIGVDTTLNVYYSDASHTVQVGTRDWLCNGQEVVTGVQTNYATFTTAVCGEGGGGNDPGPSPVGGCLGHLVADPYPDCQP